MFAPMKSRSGLILGHLGSKTRSPGQIKGKTCKHSRDHIFEAVIMNVAQNICLDDFCMYVKFNSKSLFFDQKLGHQAKSKEKFVNTLAVTFMKQSSWILLIVFVLMSSKSSSKLGHLGSKTRSPGQISRKPCLHSSGHIFESVIMNFAQYVRLDDF